VVEYRAGKAAQALKNMLPQKVKVRRAAGELVIPVEEVTEGDIVILEEGDKVPADIRLVEVNGLQVNNATITGESDVLERSAGPSGADSISGC
jgi:P-type E1-E2 ATPase